MSDGDLAIEIFEYGSLDMARCEVCVVVIQSLANFSFWVIGSPLLNKTHMLCIL